MKFRHVPVAWHSTRTETREALSVEILSISRFTFEIQIMSQTSCHERKIVTYQYSEFRDIFLSVNHRCEPDGE